MLNAITLVPAEISAVYNPYLQEFFYAIIGLVFIANGVKAFKDTSVKKHVTTGLFWSIMGVCFIVGKYIPSYIVGFLITFTAVLTAIGGVVETTNKAPTKEETRANANRIGYKVFIPALTLALASVAFSVLGIVSGNNAIGVSAILGVIAVLSITKAPAKSIITEGNRLLDNMGAVAFLPQLLSALGSLFTAAGVGTVISGFVAALVPEHAHFIACAVYCIGMALFTMIMGNGFAAFSVITVGVGIPFLINEGANPAIVGTLGLTAGYCGTLLTPMAANFNIMPAALLETKGKYAIIKGQAPIAIVMLIIHIVLMYFWAF
ncbi:MAG: DUF979 domain-containing protein [Bulleidia sp.]|nr:DUF979 domain-containing protein [Bulleidia sp.]